MTTATTLRDLVGDEAEEAQNWLRDFRKHMLSTTITLTAARLPEAHARAFPVHIARGSEAETWWNTLAPHEQNHWPTIQTQFDIKWPLAQPRVIPIKEHIDAFHAHIFPPEDIDARLPTGVGSQTRWAHTVYAERLKTLGTKTTQPDEALILDAQKQIPPVMRKLMRPHARTTWALWCAALGALDTDDILADLETEKAIGERITVLESAAAAAAQASWHQRSYTAPYHQQQASAAQYHQQPTTPANWNTLDAAPPPRSVASIARVEQERRDWAAQYPDGKAYASRSYPLTPGTASASKGCSRCGAEGHSRYGCTQTTPLPELEQQYRGSVQGRLERLASAPPPTPMTPGALGGQHSLRGNWTPRAQGFPRGYATPRGRGGFRGQWMPPTPGTPSPLHHVDAVDDSLDEEVLADIAYEIEQEQGNGDEAA